MTIEEYKIEIDEFLVNEVGEYLAKQLLKLYDVEIDLFYRNKLTPGQAGTLMIMGYWVFIPDKKCPLYGI